MKLKTLEDMEMYKTYKKLLKEEAIKWVKESQRMYKHRIDEGKFMEFFNITEEDLI